MKRAIASLGAFALISIFSPAALGADGGEECVPGTAPVDCHFANVNYLVLRCRLMTEVGLMDGSMDQPRQCLSDAKSKAKGTYKRATVALARNPKAAAALKKYQVRFLTAIDGMTPKMGETEREWKRRLAKLEEELELAENEVRVEM